MEEIRWRPEKELEDIKECVLEAIKDALELADESEVYFHDIIFEIIDTQACNWSRKECLALIDYCNNEEYIDSGIVDMSSLDRILVTMAFACVEQKLFDDDFMQYLQAQLNNEIPTLKEADEITERIKAELFSMNE